MVVHKIDDGFEQLNSGIDEEPEDAGPGVLGHFLISLSQVKERVAAAHLPYSPRSRSTPNTPSGVATSEHEHEDEDEVADVKDGPHIVERKVGEDPEDHSPLDQQHQGDVGLDSAEDGRHIGDGVSPKGSSRSAESHTSSTGSGRSVESHASSTGSGHSNWEGTEGLYLGERLISRLPGGHSNPYALASPTTPQATSAHIAADHSVMPASPSSQRVAPLSLHKLGSMELVNKLADKLHLRKKGLSPRAAAESPGTPTQNTSTGLPSPTIGSPSSSSGTAIGPKEE